MATDVELANQALRLVGGAQIVSFDDGTPEAELIRDAFPVVRDALLVLQPWPFAVERRDLGAPRTDQPAYGFVNRFTLPVDCLKVLGTDQGVLEEFAVENRTLLIDTGSVIIRGIFQRTQATLWSAAFSQSFKWQLAADIAYPLTHSRARAAELQELAQAQVERFMHADLQGHGPQVEMPGFRGVRHGGSSRLRQW